MTRVPLSILLASLICVLSAGPAQAQNNDDEDSRLTLARLKGVAVSVQIPAEVGSKMVVQAEVELQLRQAGVPVITTEEAMNRDGAFGAFLKVIVGVAKLPQSDTAICQLHVVVTQAVTCKANGELALASTWAIDRTGPWPVASLPKFREKIADYLKVFINAWYAANPKR